MNKKTIATLSAAVLAAVSLIGATHAATIASDSFEYSTGTLNGQNGGTGFSGAYFDSTSSTVSSPGFTYTDGSLNTLASAGNKAESTGDSSGTFRLFSTSQGAPNTTLYLSFIMQAAGTGGYAGLSLFQGGNENIFLGKPNGTGNFAVDGNGVGQASSVAATTQSLLVFRLDFGATNTVTSLFVNPTLGVEPLTADASFTRTNFTFDRIRLQGNTAATYDEIRLGTTYADVTPVPEPSTTVALGMGVLGLIAVGVHRRRKLA